MKNKKLLITAIALCILIPATLFTTACSDTSSTITEAGSTTVQPLAEKFAEAYMAINPDINITVAGGGSSTGVKSANDGTVDIGAASREIKDSDPPVTKWLIAKDGIAVITSKENTIEGLTKEQLVKIYNGTITNWKEVGGSDADIDVVAREEGSGTRSAFEEMVMGEELIVKTAILQQSNGALKTTVATDPDAIGFLSFGYIDSNIKALAIDGVEATEENALSGTYPIVRPLYFLTQTDSPRSEVKAFLDFCTGSEGQEIVAGEGYLPIK